MARTFKNLFGLIPEKSVPKINPIVEQTRGAIEKAYIPKFIYKPPFGYPRFVDLPTIRRLAAMPYVEMCISTSIDELCAVEWGIVPKEESEEISSKTQSHIDEVKAFFENPNTNKESFEEIRKKYLRDIFEIDAGVINKMFNVAGQMVEMVARDGATFTKNPDIYGMMTDREDLLLDEAGNPQVNIAMNNKEAKLMEPGWITAADAREKAAYFQYGWISGARPVPFGKKEIIWMERNPRTDSIYGRSPVEILADTIQTLIYAIEHDLEYFNDNSIPKGIIGLEGADSEAINAFRDQWLEQQRKKDSAGNWKKIFHHVPIVGQIPVFTRMQFTNAELELLEGQKWWAKMVWACFGVTSVELGYTEDAAGMANQIVQSNVFKKRVLNPILRLEEYKINHELIPEFGYDDIKFTFMTYDVEEEVKKANLYKIQLESGLMTVNEIRKQEGMDEVEWGDEPPNKWSASGGNNFNFPNPYNQEYNRNSKETQMQSRPEKIEESGDQEEKARTVGGFESPEPGDLPEKGKEILAAAYAECRKNGGSKEKCSKIAWGAVRNAGYKSEEIEGKPGMGHSDKWWEIYHALIKEGHSKESAAKIANSKVEEKAMDSEENPLILREGEVMNEERLRRSIVYLLKENKKKIDQLIEKEIGQNKLKEIKSLGDIIKAIKSLLSFAGIRAISDMVIKNTFVSGWEDSEKQLDMNIMINKEAIQFIQEYTFKNIVGMTDEIADDLRAELERAIMGGEGIAKIKDRVSKVFDVGENRAEMIARTESNRAENQGKLQAFKSSGKTYKKKWVAAMDSRTSDLCKRLDGKKVGMNDNFKDSKGEFEGPCPPAHINCRSTVVYLAEGEE